MDIVDDASSAIHHVQTYGLSGPTKYNDMGEKYLRLYGLLSATYIQQQAILTIYKLMQVPNPKNATLRFAGLQIRDLRHKLSAHSTDYMNRTTGTQEAYVPQRFDLGDMKVTVVNYTGSSPWEEVDLAKAIQSHIEVAIDTLDCVLEKSIGTVFKQDQGRRDSFMSKLSDLRIEKKGGLVFDSGSGPKIIVTSDGAET